MPHRRIDLSGGNGLPLRSRGCDRGLAARLCQSQHPTLLHYRPKRTDLETACFGECVTRIEDESVNSTDRSQFAQSASDEQTAQNPVVVIQQLGEEHLVVVFDDEHTERRHDKSAIGGQVLHYYLCNIHSGIYTQK